jgi:hypothetical protein
MSFEGLTQGGFMMLRLEILLGLVFPNAPLTQNTHTYHETSFRIQQSRDNPVLKVIYWF